MTMQKGFTVYKTILFKLFLFVVTTSVILAACDTADSTPTATAVSIDAATSESEPTTTPEPPATAVPEPTATPEPSFQATFAEADCQFDVPPGRAVRCGYLTVP